MKETPGSLSAYFIFVGIFTILLAILPSSRGSIAINVIHQILIYVSFIVSGFLIYFGLNMKKYLKKSPKTLKIFILAFFILNIILSQLSVQLFRLIVGIAIGGYLLDNINKVSKELKDKEIKSKAVQEAKDNITSAEKIYYEDKDVNITNLQAIIMEEIYQITDITSVDLKSKPPNYAIAIFSAVVGAFLMLCGYLFTMDTGNKDAMIILIVMVALGVILVVNGFVVGFTLKKSYIVKICCASIETDAMLSLNKEYIQGIVDSIKQAINERGI